MLRWMCKSKIHRAVVTEANVAYEGSITIDRRLMQAADLCSYERVQVASLTTGERLETYVIEGEEGSGTIGMNGAAAHRVKFGEVIHIISYAHMEDRIAKEYRPKVIHLDEKNRIIQEVRGERLAPV